MKEYVLVEFVASLPEEAADMTVRLMQLGDDFQPLYSMHDMETHIDIGQQALYHVSGRITSEYASIIKLTDPFLAERMRISYISEELKDRYRT